MAILNFFLCLLIAGSAFSIAAYLRPPSDKSGSVLQWGLTGVWVGYLFCGVIPLLYAEWTPIQVTVIVRVFLALVAVTVFHIMLGIPRQWANLRAWLKGKFQ